MLKLLKKIFLSSETDKQVHAIHEESKAMLDETSRTAKRHEELLNKNGFSLRIYIATGGDKHD